MKELDEKWLSLFLQRKDEKMLEDIDEIISLCRQYNKLYKMNADTLISGDDLLKDLLEKGVIKMDLFCQLKILIDNPELKYTINENIL
jgi:hypothetical protein